MTIDYVFTMSAPHETNLQLSQLDILQQRQKKAHVDFKCVSNLALRVCIAGYYFTDVSVK